MSYYPHGLSYYSRLIGGLRGATLLGMEPTYYWDSLDRETLDWLADHTGRDEKIFFAAYPPRNLELLKRWGLLDRLSTDRGTFRWYVLQRRPSAHQRADRWLIENERPAFGRTFAGVPLLEVYSYEQYERSKRATAGPREAPHGDNAQQDAGTVSAPPPVSPTPHHHNPPRQPRPQSTATRSPATPPPPTRERPSTFAAYRLSSPAFNSDWTARRAFSPWRPSDDTF